MLAVVKKPHIELAITGEGAREALEWLGRKFRVHVISGEDRDKTVKIEDTDFYKEMELNRAGNLLEGARLKAGLSQKDVAAAMGIRQSMVSDYENGRRRITDKMAKRFAGVLKIKAERLL